MKHRGRSRPEKTKKERKVTYHRRGVGARVRLHAELPVLREATVGDEVHRVCDLCAREIPGARPTRVSVAAHLTDQMRPTLEWQDSARHEGGQQVGPSQAGGLNQDPKSLHGGGSGRSQRLGAMRPAGLPPSWRAGYERRQVDPVAVGGNVLYVKVRTLPHLHRLDQRDGGEGVVCGKPPQRDEGAALGWHVGDVRAELGVEEFPPQLDCGENAEVTLAKSDEGRQQHHRVRGEVVRLEAVEFQERAEEPARRQPKAAREMGAEDDALALRRAGDTSVGGGARAFTRLALWMRRVWRR